MVVVVVKMDSIYLSEQRGRGTPDSLHLQRKTTRTRKERPTKTPAGMPNIGDDAAIGNDGPHPQDFWVLPSGYRAANCDTQGAHPPIAKHLITQG